MQKNMKTVVISQPRYLPIIGYFQRLCNANLFVFLDNVQRQARGVENRNRILNNGKIQWLTIPVASSSRSLIYDTVIAGSEWVSKHKNILREAYKKHDYFDEGYIELYYKDVENVLEKTRYNYAETIIHTILNACDMFGINIRDKIVKATDLNIPNSKGVENLYNIMKAVGGGIYVSGSNGRVYGVKEYFEARGIKVLFHDPEILTYPQKGAKEFVPWLCFFDTLFNIGYDKTREMIFKKWSLKEE